MDNATIIRAVGIVITLILAVLVYDQLNTKELVLKEGESFTLGSILAVAKWKFLLIGIVDFGSALWGSEIEKTGELAGRPKTGFEGFVYVASGIMGFVSLMVGLLSLALFMF